MKAALAVIGVIIILSLFGTMLYGINQAQTDDREDSFAAVATGVGETTADVVLVTDPYDDDILNIASISSDNSSDAPLPDSYTTGSNTLTVRGLNPSDSRDLTVVYSYAALTGPTVSFLGMVPVLVGIAAVCILVGAAIAIFARRG